jgi:hypothetical protein
MRSRSRPEVAHQAVHVESRVDLGQLGGACVHDRLVDVERDVALEAALAGHRVQKRPRLRGRARAQLDELFGTRALDDRRRVPVQDLALAAGRVVLGQGGDAVEELGAALVVEELRRQLTRRAGQPFAHVVGERALHLVALDDDAHQASSTQRKPAKICRRLG